MDHQRWKTRTAADEDWYAAAAAMNHINEAIDELLKITKGGGPGQGEAVRLNSELLRLRRKLEREFRL